MSSIPNFGPNPPATSGTYNFAPGLGELVLYAYGLAGIRRTELTQQHLEDARMASNLTLSSWSAKGVNLWQVDLQCVPLIQGCGEYVVPNNTITILDVYITFNTGVGEIDRIILPVSRTEYASYSNKYQQGFPTTFWFDRLLAPKLVLWPTPDGTANTLKYYRLRQNQDAVLANGTQAEIPIYFQDAFALAVAYRLAMIYAAPRALALKPLADEAYASAASQNIENATQYISPMTNGYYR